MSPVIDASADVSSGVSGLAPGFEVPLHRSLTEPILLGGAPPTVAIANGTLAAALGLGLQLWLPGLVCGSWVTRWPSGGARVDPQFMTVFGTSRCWTREERAHAASCRISPAPGHARRLAALGGTGGPRRRAQQGRQLPAHGALSRVRPGQCHARRTDRDHGAPEQRAAPLRIGLGALCRSRAPAGAGLSHVGVSGRLVLAGR
ncbi:Conjugative transfer protein TrbD [Candidatus Burkholderia humilis]|nr:Conjugative transfer protein TrbD [Candidatus Burkholderia humilis]